ncbi:9104_t:CDS:2, partial [Rhizophagus irregularis]
MDDFTILLVKLKDLIDLSTGNGSPKSNTSSNNFSLPNSDEFSEMLTEMIVHICFTASNMLPDDVESTNTDALMEVALLRDTSEQFGKILLKWTENNKREYMDELKCESLIKMISSQINKPICDSSKLSLKNRLTQLTEPNSGFGTGYTTSSMVTATGRMKGYR